MIKSNYVSKFSFDSINSKTCFETIETLAPQDIIDEIVNSKLRGCGGAGFPAGTKLAVMAKETSKPKYVICNADEGDPGSFKDREILTNYADLVLTGMAIAAKAIDSQKGILYLRAEYAFLKEHLIAEIARCKIFTGFQIELQSGAGAYVCGEETALIESLEGKSGKPRNRPPFPTHNGYLGNPSEVNNVETFAWITTIMSKGAKWFSSVGTEKSAGYKIFSISGDCNRPGVYEFPMGSTIAEMLKEVGGADAKAVQIGGAAGQLVHSSKFNRKIAYEDAPSSGSVIVFGPNRNMIDISENFLEFFVDESCGMCVPCREGNVKLLESIRMLKSCSFSENDLEKLYSLAKVMKSSSKCGLGQNSSNIFVSVTKDFANEIKRLNNND